MSAPASRPLDGRVALVTGGGRGIGLAIARRLAASGAKLVVADSGTGIDGTGADPTVAAEAAASIGAAAAYPESVASPEGAAAAVDLAVRRFGALDIVVNNAAILRDGFLFKSRPGDWEAVIRNNLSAAAFVLMAAAPVLKDQAKAGRGADEGADGGADEGENGNESGRWGRIMNIVSTAGLYGNYGQAAYAAAKAGLVGLTRVAALDMARSGVACNAVAPFAATRVTRAIRPANEAQAAYRERALAVPAEPVADLVAHLAGPAGADVTGQLFGVRGREVFLFSQPRPAARFDTAETPLGQGIETVFRDGFAPLETDLEAFSTAPLL